MADDGDTRDGLIGVDADHHGDRTLRAGGGNLHDIAGVRAAVGHGIHLDDLAALRGGSRGDGVGDVHLVAELAALGGHGAHGNAGVLRVLLGDLVLGHVVDDAQQSGDQSDHRQGAGDLQNKLTGDFHFAAASFFSFLGAP